VVTKRLSIRWLDRLWQAARAARGVRLVHAEGAAREVLRATRSGEIVAMLVDQAPDRGRSVVRASFLGAPAWVDLSPAILARRARVPLVAAFPIRNPDGTHAVRVAGVLDLSPGGACPAPAEAMLQITAWLDAFVRAHPEQWLWMHRRWKPLPEPLGSAEPSR
jgi:KDO2-lipid IV(A) lauroyltransferase